MGNVAISIKIMPASPDVDIGKLKDEICKKVDVQDSKIEPLAFGLKALRIVIVRPDKEGGSTEGILETLREIDGVGDVEEEAATLI